MTPYSAGAILLAFVFVGSCFSVALLWAVSRRGPFLTNARRVKD